METVTELPIVVIDGQAYEAVEFPDADDNKEYLSGYELARQVEKVRNLAGRADFNLFLIRPELIPDAWNSIFPVFAGTTEHGRFGFLGFSILVWCQRFLQWLGDKRWFGWGFPKKYCRLVRRVPALTFEAKHLASPSS